MRLVLIAVFAACGLAAGWAQRAVIIRLAVPAGQPATTTCQDCDHPVLTAGFLSLPRTRWPGRCRHCGRRTGPPALTVELTSAIALALLADRITPGLVLAAAAWLVLCGVPLAFIDLAVHRLPDVLTAPAYAGVIAFLALAAWAGGTGSDLARAAAGGLALAAAFLAMAFISPGGVGLGDAKAAAATGTLLAWFGWGPLLTGTFAGLVLAAAFGLVLLVRGAGLRYQLAFGPFMLAGAVLVVLFTG
jgi:leader peptidase (prepilin peptidase)/N-methyltransferase